MNRLVWFDRNDRVRAAIPITKEDKKKGRTREARKLRDTLHEKRFTQSTS